MIRIILKENISNTLDKNVEFLLRSEFGQIWGLDKDVKINLAEIEMLFHSLIVKQLGAGAYGTAFLLSNGLVLKIYKKNGEEPELFSRLASAGRGKANIPFYHDFGDFVKSGPLFGMKYYIMPRLKTAESFIQEILKKKDVYQESDDLAYVMIHFSVLMNRVAYSKATRQASFDSIFNFMIKRCSDASKLSKTYKITKTLKWLGPTELRKVCKAVFDMKQANPKAYDFHSGNLGVDQHGNWIMFDY